MRRILIAALASTSLLAGVSGAAACSDGQRVAIEGTVTEIFLNKGKTWSIVAGHLSDPGLDGCGTLPGTFGQKTARGTSILLTSPRKPASCNVGSRVHGSIRIEDQLFVLAY